MQASDTIALASVLASAVVALAGLAIAFISGKRDREQAVWLAERNRQQSRLESTYVELLTFAEEVGMWAQLILPVVGGDPDEPLKGLPEMPSYQREAAVRAKTAALASDAVREALDPWRQTLQDVRVKVTLVQMRRGQAREQQGSVHMTEDWTDWNTPWMELETEARPAEARAREALQHVVADELKILRLNEPPTRRSRRFKVRSADDRRSR